MITYNWDCRTVDAYVRDGEHKDLVYKVHWRLEGVSDVPLVSISTTGTQGISISDVTNFIPFEDLTNEMVVAWTKEAMGEYQVSVEEADIAARIEEIINPVSVTLTIGEIPSEDIIEEPLPVPIVNEDPVEEPLSDPIVNVE
tara:strand:- start:7287 stop:7712 length:426 start_codon:yes stop_codon:yes gene_type:complete